MPQLDVYIWGILISTTFFSFVFCYIIVVFFFLVKIGRVLYLKDMLYNKMHVMTPLTELYTSFFNKGLFYFELAVNIYKNNKFSFKLASLFKLLISINMYTIPTIWINFSTLRVLIPQINFIVLVSQFIGTE